MRKTLILLFGLFASLAMNAQELISGSIDAFKGKDDIQVVFNYDKAIVQGLLFEDFMAKEQREFSNPNFANFQEEWDKSLAPEHLQRFIAGYNKQNLGMEFANFSYKEKPTKLTVYYFSLERTGKAVADYILTDANGNRLAVIRWESPRGGLFGTFLNLLGDAGEKNGKKFYRFLNPNQSRGFNLKIIDKEINVDVKDNAN